MRFERSTNIHSARKLVWLVAFLAVLGAVSCGGGSGTPATQARGLDKINHVIVVYQENWSFDGLYGNFPGANGIANAGEAAGEAIHHRRQLLPRRLWWVFSQPPLAGLRLRAGLAGRTRKHYGGARSKRNLHEGRPGDA